VVEWGYMEKENKREVRKQEIEDKLNTEFAFLEDDADYRGVISDIAEVISKMDLA
jgi:hypothetical protein